MFFDIDDRTRRKARWAHELFVINILIFHLLLTPLSIFLDVGLYGLLLPLVFSSSVIAVIYFRGRNMQPWFAAAHWRLAFKRSRLLLMGYAATAAILGVGGLITLGGTDQNMRDIMLTVFTRIAIMPTLVIVMITVVLEAGGINQVIQGEVPDSLVTQFPPQGDLSATESA